MGTEKYHRLKNRYAVVQIGTKFIIQPLNFVSPDNKPIEKGRKKDQL
jgi:hypothetical protein